MRAIDFHDDPLQALKDLPREQLTKVGSYPLPTREDLNNIPKNRFALVVHSEDGIHKKFLCDGPQSTLLAVHAFNKVADELPQSMRDVAGSFLQRAAYQYDVAPPVGSYSREMLSNEVAGEFPKEQVKTASSSDMADCQAHVRWFDDYGDTLEPRGRREYALKVASMFEGHHLPLPTGALSKYAGTDFGSSFHTQIRHRLRLVDDVVGGALQSLEKAAESLGPDGVAEALAVLDHRAGIEHLWGDRIEDPYASVYDGHHVWVKTASDSLVEKARLCEGKLRESFGDRFYQDLLNAPEAVMEALPRPEREVFDRILGA